VNQKKLNYTANANAVPWPVIHYFSLDYWEFSTIRPLLHSSLSGYSDSSRL